MSRGIWRTTQGPQTAPDAPVENQADAVEPQTIAAASEDVAEEPEKSVDFPPESPRDTAKKRTRRS